MGQLRKFLRLPRRKRSLLIQAALLLFVIQTGLIFLPFSFLRRTLAKGSQLSGSRRNVSWSADPVVWAVSVASRYLPGTRRCLPQALAVQALLACQGHPSRFRIGVAKDPQGKFQAHAWVESPEGIVISGGPAFRFTPLMEQGGQR